MSITLKQAVDQSDEIEINGYTYVGEYAEFVRNGEDSSWHFEGDGDASLVLLAQVLKLGENGRFMAVTDQGEEVSIRFIRVEKTDLTVEAILAYESQPEA